MLYEKMCSEHQRLEQEIAAIEKKIRQLPEGKLICTRNGVYTKWFQSDGHHSTYIPRKNKEKAEQLAVKKYLEARKEELLHEQRAIAFYLRHHKKDASCAEQLLSDESLYSELLLPHFIPDSQELYQWMTQPYGRNPNFQEKCIHKTSAGILVRSKSEALITMLLHINKIPFRYECPLVLSDTTVYPDFTIRHPQTGETYYWEHFGLMDNSSYRKAAFSKLQLYADHGIFPSVQLLTTYETMECPLDSNIVENFIRYYFL